MESRPLNDSITKSKAEKAINKMKCNKALGENEIPTELLEHSLDKINDNLSKIITFLKKIKRKSTQEDQIYNPFKNETTKNVHWTRPKNFLNNAKSIISINKTQEFKNCNRKYSRKILLKENLSVNDEKTGKPKMNKAGEKNEKVSKKMKKLGSVSSCCE